MRKGFLATGILLIAVFASVYLFIPSRLIISEVGIAKCSLPAAKRFIFDGSNWTAWKQADSLSEDAYRHQLTNTFYSKADVIISNKNDIRQTALMLVPFGMDSIGVEWKDTIATGNNPFTRITRYNNARQLKKHMDALMSQLLGFLNNKDNIYSTHIFKEQLADRPLLTRRIVLERFPTADDAYNLINTLNLYARQSGDSATGPAMKYSSTIDSLTHELMVAIPTSKTLKGTNEFIIKNLVGGNLIATEIRGGEGSIQIGWNGIRAYKADYQLSSPAIPFESMITDRTKEPDTSKWITRIYYPVRI